jgi:hypothetical protein
MVLVPLGFSGIKQFAKLVGCSFIASMLESSIFC